MTITANELQLKFIASIKKKIEATKKCDQIIEVPLIDVASKDSLCTKPVIVFAPDISFPSCMPLKCIRNGCSGALKVKGWHDKYRYIHSTDCGYYALQKLYTCSSCKMDTTALTVLQDSKSLPNYVRLRYPVTFAGTLCFHTDLANIIVNDALTGKTFDEICESIKSLRLSRYLLNKAMYLSWMTTESPSSIGRHYSSTSASSALETFPSFDDKLSFNESVGPVLPSILDYFNFYVEDRSGFLDECLDSVIPFCVLSLDGTYNIQKRTRARTTSNTFESIPEDCSIFLMNATGEILEESSSVRETTVAIKSILNVSKTRSDRLNSPYPRVIFTDNAGAQENAIKSVFPGCRVGQDLKHVINRVIDHCSKGHTLYGSFCQHFHGALAGTSKVPVQSRNGKWYEVSSPLRDPADIISAGDRSINYFKDLPDCNGLFSQSFEGAWILQKEVIRKYVFEIYVDGTYATIFDVRKYLINNL